MGELAARLSRISESSEKSISPYLLEKMHRATADLQRTGRAESALGEGDNAPNFRLPDSYGNFVRLTDILARAPAIVSFFRGHW